MEGFYLAPNRDSFRLAKTNESIEKGILGATQVDPVRSRGTLRALAASNGVEELANNVKDFNKRGFLKILGVTGLGLAGTALFPKKADALILGGTPTSSVVGVKNVANTRINPATEETLDEVLKTTDLTFDTGTGDLQVKVTSVSGDGSGGFSTSADETTKSALVDAARHVQVDVLSSALPTTASTETTLETIAFGGKKYALRLATVGDVDYVGEANIGTLTSAADWRVKKVDSTTGIIIQWAGTTAGNAGGFDYIWDNYATLDYF